MSHNQNSSVVTAATTQNTSSALLSVPGSASSSNAHRNHIYDFKQRRSSSEPVHDQALLQAMHSPATPSPSPTPIPSPSASASVSKQQSQTGKDDCEDDVIAKNDDYIECLQKMTKVSERIKQSSSSSFFSSFLISNKKNLTLLTSRVFLYSFLSVN